VSSTLSSSSEPSPMPSGEPMPRERSEVYSCLNVKNC
jgi:hypothetical protein